MTYTGDVSVGGPSDTREINGLTVTKIAVGPYENNAYLLRDGSGQALLIDAAAEPERLLAMIGDTPVQRIVTTHQHPDHWQALAEVKARPGRPRWRTRRTRPASRCRPTSSSRTAARSGSATRPCP